MASRTRRPPRPRIDLRDVPRGRPPHDVRPMLATLVDQPFDRKGWIFEPKWDGFRAVAEVGPKGVALYSRNQKPFEHRFAPIVEALRGLSHTAVFDGEIVVVDDQGRSNFQLLQNYQRTGDGDLRYYVFDILHLDGHDLRGLPLRRRKEILAQIVDDCSPTRERELPVIHVSEHIDEHGVAFFRAAADAGLEGIVAKDAKSHYREGFRGGEWLKIKTYRRQEAAIGGFTDPRGSRQDLGALILGVYENGQLIYIGHTGGGLRGRDLAELRARLTPLIRPTCPFTVRPGTNAPPHWVEPKVVCEVKFQEWTADGLMRHPIYLGLREDKPASSVHRERATPALRVTAGGNGASCTLLLSKPKRATAISPR